MKSLQGVTKNYLRAEEMLQSVLEAEFKKEHLTKMKERNRAIEAALQKNRHRLARAQKRLYRSWYLAFCKYGVV